MTGPESFITPEFNKQETLYAFEKGKLIKITKTKLQEIPVSSKIVSLLNINNEINVANISGSTSSSNKFEIGDEVYQLEDGRIASLEIPYSKGIEISK